MLRDDFYRFCEDQDGQCAYKTNGYSDGDIGLHEEKGCWIATHIPTGMMITPTTSRHKSSIYALNEAKRITAAPEFEERFAKIKKTQMYKAFKQSRDYQSVWGGF